MTIEKKDSAVRFELKATDDGSMTIAGYGSTFGGDPDAYRDLIAPGAFTASLRERMPKMLYQHDSSRICGVWDEAYEDSKGLYLKGHFIDTTLGRDAYQEAKSGALASMSIGYSTKSYTYDEDADVRTLQEVKLWEVSLVTFPANENAIITSIKHNMPGTIREFEKLLRDAGGYSLQQAKAIAADGWKAIDPQRPVGPDLTPLYDALSKFHDQFSQQ